MAPPGSGTPTEILLPLRAWFRGSTSAFQADDAGSIPAARFFFPLSFLPFPLGIGPPSWRPLAGSLMPRGNVIEEAVESGGAADALPQTATHAESSGGSEEGQGARYDGCCGGKRVRTRLIADGVFQ